MSTLYRGLSSTSAASRVLSLQRSTPLPQSIRLPALYPTIEEALYPAVYPYSLQCIYPTATSNSCSVSVPTATYPFATGICTPTHPFSLRFSDLRRPRCLSVQLGGHLPEDDCRGRTCFSDRCVGLSVFIWNLSVAIFADVFPLHAAEHYLDPAVYPYSMMAIYPPVQIEAGEGLSLGVDCHLHSRYPYLQLCESYAFWTWEMLTIAVPR